MTRKGIAALAAVVLVLGFAGCKKNKPDTSEDMMVESTTVEPEAEEVTSPPEPTVQDDETPDPLSGDLQDANQYARSEGLLGDVFFDFDKYDLKSDARERLAQNARFLLDNPEFVVTIEGHCDERGTNEYNLALGERRANSAKDYLESLGVDSSRLRTVSYGEERPFCTQSNEACWAQNRRAHFVLTGRSDVG